MMTDYSKRLTAVLLSMCFFVFAQRTVAEVPQPHGGFVTAEGTKLKLNGGGFYFSGVNSYSILYSEAEAEQQFEILSDMGANVLRFWGFWNGEDLNPQLDEDGRIIRQGTPDTDIYGRYVLQSKPGVYPEQGWRRMDYAIYLAHVYGIKLIIPLMNQWPEFGGIDLYLNWVGIDINPPPAFEGHYRRENHIKEYRGLFWDSTNPNEPRMNNLTDKEKKAWLSASANVKQIYLDYVTYMLNRVNTYTGIAYKDDPAIMIWEIFNEPRFGPWGGNSDCDKVTKWLADAAAHIKSIDKNHLVATGEEGFMREGTNSLGRVTYPWKAGSGEGIDFEMTAGLDDIDILSIHSWPFQWNLWETSEGDNGRDLSSTKEYSDPETGAPLFEKFVAEWIEEHVRIAEEHNKPIYLGEFGYQILRAGESTLGLRDSIFQATYDTCKTAEITGATVFNILASHDVDSAVYTGPMERKTMLMGQINDVIMPHDLDYKFDVYCPEDESTCNIIREFSIFQNARIENPDLPFDPPCLSPQTICDDKCIFTDSHPDHCGQCGTVCKKNETCELGQCTLIVDTYNEQLNEGDGGCSIIRLNRSASNWKTLTAALLL